MGHPAAYHVGCTSIGTSICTSILTSVHPSICPLIVRRSTYLSVCSLLHLFVSLFILSLGQVPTLTHRRVFCRANGLVRGHTSLNTPVRPTVNNPSVRRQSVQLSVRPLVRPTVNPSVGSPVSSSCVCPSVLTLPVRPSVRSPLGSRPSIHPSVHFVYIRPYVRPLVRYSFHPSVCASSACSSVRPPSFLPSIRLPVHSARRPTVLPTCLSI